MTLALALRRTRREFARPSGNARTEWREREAAIITLTGDGSNRGRGEVAPLPGFGPDTLDDCERALLGLNLDGIPEKLGSAGAVFAELRRASERLRPEFPAARAGLEAALLELWSRAEALPAWALLRGQRDAPRARRLAALLAGEPEGWPSEAATARARGLTTFKLKVGRDGGVERELAGIARLRSELGPKSKLELRLDANRAWTANQASAHLARFAAYAPEFVEEPCASAELAALDARSVRLALDESLAERAAEREAVAALVARGVSVFVLKPTLLGGISACYAWARAAREAGAEAILSHTFDGPLGLALSAALALGVGSERIAHGLDLTGARLAHERLPFFSGAELQAWTSPGFGEIEP